MLFKARPNAAPPNGISHIPAGSSKISSWCRLLEGYRPFDPQYGYLFNSYYETVGTFFPRPLRGLLSRPTVEDIYRYRAHVDGHMEQLLQRLDRQPDTNGSERVTLGLHHEQQHQELLLTDHKHLLCLNPLRPVYRPIRSQSSVAGASLHWLEFPAGTYAVGADGQGFAFDNEMPRHRVFLDSFSLASRPVNNGEYVEFIEAGGYRNAALWLADGWRKINEAGWVAPLYWERTTRGLVAHDLGGVSAVKSSGSRMPCELLRGRCLRALGR